MSRSRHTYFRVPGRPPSPGLESCVRGSVLVKIGSYSYRLSKWSTVQTPRVPNTCTAEQCNRMLAQVTDIPHSVKRLALQYMQLFAVPLSRERSCRSIDALCSASDLALFLAACLEFHVLSSFLRLRRHAKEIAKCLCSLKLGGVTTP